jgi:hypothetical protein
MMSGILNALDEKEHEAENLFLDFIEAQKETALSLKNSLLEIKDITAQDAGEKIILVKEQLSRIAELHENRKEVAIKSFTDFQKLHNRLMDCLEELLKKGNQILVQDIKEIKNQIIREIDPVGLGSEKVN